VQEPPEQYVDVVPGIPTVVPVRIAASIWAGVTPANCVVNGPDHRLLPLESVTVPRAARVTVVPVPPACVERTNGEICPPAMIEHCWLVVKLVTVEQSVETPGPTEVRLNTRPELAANVMKLLTAPPLRVKSLMDPVSFGTSVPVL
jgi:hypothetical protein